MLRDEIEIHTIRPGADLEVSGRAGDHIQVEKTVKMRHFKYQVTLAIGNSLNLAGLFHFPVRTFLILRELPKLAVNIFIPSICISPAGH